MEVTLTGPGGGAALSEGRGEDGELRQGTDLVWEQKAT